MGEATEADRYLLDQIGRGNADAWTQLVGRYNGRLLAFARGRLPRHEDAADAVQETFLRFLQSWRGYRPDDGSLETFLFTILRRRLIDGYRGRRMAPCTIRDDEGGGPADPGPTPSGYARRDERNDLLERAIAAGLDGMVGRLRDRERFEEIKAAELLFYAQLKNKDVAPLCGMDERQVGVFKFRALEQIRTRATAALSAPGREAVEAFRWADEDAADSLLTRAWKRLRPTCPKRSTLGRLLLGTLDDGRGWRPYVEFHLHRLGCRLCLANWQDLRREQSTPAADAAVARDRILRSTVGFLSRAGPLAR